MMSKWFSALIAVVVLMLLPSTALAAPQGESWYWIVAAMVTISAIISVILVLRNKEFDKFITKAVAFGAWFWLFVFIQIMIYGFYVGLTK